MNTASYWIDKLELQEHPEGGYYREIYRSDELIDQEALPDRYSNDRSFGTSIYFLITADRPSNFHRLQSDELWYFHKGSPLTIHTISETGEYRTVILGDVAESHLQMTIPRGAWFGATVNDENSYSLISCAVIPGFAFADFELADKEALIANYPAHRFIINLLTGQ